MLSCVQLFVTLWSVAYQAPLAIEFSRQEYWIRVPFSPPEDLLNPGIELPPLVPPNFFTAPSGKPYGFIKQELPILNDSEDTLRHCTGFGVNIIALYEY